MMTDRDIPSNERAQAFTLEGFISAIVILTAVLFALQAVVITPTTGGAVDRAAQAQEEQEVRDALLIAGENGNLSDLVRNWDPDEEGNDQGGWQNASAPGPAAYNSSQLANESQFGQILEEHFVNASGKSYNLEFIATNDLGTHVEPIVRMGGGTSDSVVSASYTVTLHDEQEFTGDSQNRTLEDASSNHDYPLPPADNPPISEMYNVVEVRLTVW